MVLSRLGKALYDALRRVFRAPAVDEKLVNELVRDIQRALLQADVNVRLVFALSERVRERALKEELPPGISRREHVIKVVYEELVRLVGEKPVDIGIKPGQRKVIMLVGLQGSGKTTSAAKLAYFFKKKGLKVGLICADTYRPGAYAQLAQLAERVGVPFCGEPEGKDPVGIALRGLKELSDLDVIIIDTAGRHKEEKALMEEMRALAEVIKPDEVMLVIDATIGQQAAVQARAFHEATPIGSIFLAKLDGSARGGGALSAVAATGAPIKFVGTGEKTEDIEHFVPSRFIAGLLGIGDIESIVEKVREAEKEVSAEAVEAIARGKFTLYELREVLEGMTKRGRLSKLLGLLPGFSYELPKEAFEEMEVKVKKWLAIMNSMTSEEMANPRILNASRIRRIARGSGTDERDVRELIKYYNMMRKMSKQFKKMRRRPFALKLKGWPFKAG
ncbi:signal recognition particle protein [Candidatus Bathyarchaeota archaeon ex4484_135]|nr:MAG: signal recognition particle protein [Candidatus Bathyarchaeota archaeon ex4484_135]